jgi:hypothetical protein
MSAFPKLKTGAIAQYPAGRTLTFATDVFEFLDGTAQRCRQFSAGSRRWVIELELLDDTELTELAEFFQSQQGRFGAFSFEDPWDGTVYPDCSFENDELDIELSDEARGSMRLVVKENVD